LHQALSFIRPKSQLTHAVSVSLGRYAVVTLVQTKDNGDTEVELRKLIEKAIASTSLSETWKVDHIAFM